VPLRISHVASKPDANLGSLCTAAFQPLSGYAPISPHLAKTCFVLFGAIGHNRLRRLVPTQEPQLALSEIPQPDGLIPVLSDFTSSGTL